MPDKPLHKVNEALDTLKKLAVHTKAGSYVRVDDVEKLIAEPIEPDRSYIRTPEQARAAVKRDEEIMQHFPQRVLEPGRSVPAQEPQPSSRT